VSTPLRTKLRMRPKELFERDASRCAAEIHMTVPSRDAERSHCIQLFRRRILRGGVHDAHGLHALRRTLVKDRSRMIVVDVALLEPMVAGIRVVDLFAQFAGGMKRPVAVSKRGVHVGVRYNHTASGKKNEPSAS
jgi:hypothetical protein